MLLGALAVLLISLNGFSQATQAEDHARRGLQFAQSGNLKGAELELREAVALDPGNAGYLADLGGILGTERKLPEAGVCFSKALHLEPDNRIIRRDLAANEWQLGDFTAAEKNLEWLLRKQPNDQSPILLLGMVEANMKHYRRAAQLLRSVPDLVEQHAESLAALARSYYHTGQTEEARKTVIEMASRFNDPRSVFLAGEMAEEAGDGRMAERLFNTVRDTYPDLARLRYHLAHSTYLAGNWKACRQLLSGLIGAGYRSSEAYSLLGRCDARQNNMRDATRAYEMAIQASPSSDSTYLDLASMLSDHQLRDAAIEVMASCVKALPRSFNCYEEKGRIEESQHYYKQSVSSFRRALALNASSGAAEFGLATSLAGLGRRREAVAAYEAAIRLSPKRAEFYREYAKLLLDEAGQNGTTLRLRAAWLLEKAISLDTSSGESRLLLGELWFDEGRITRALPLLLAAARLDPQNGGPHYMLWRAYEKLGRKAEAKTELAEFRKVSLKGHEPKNRGQ